MCNKIKKVLKFIVKWAVMMPIVTIYLVPVIFIMEGKSCKEGIKAVKDFMSSIIKE